MSGGAHWLYLVVAGLFEIGWPLGLKLASNPSMKVWGLLLAVGCMGLSGLFLWLALKGYLNFMLTEGQTLAPTVGYAPLPAELQAKAIAQLDMIG